MGNSASNETCARLNQMGETVATITSNVVMPMHVIFGLLGHSLCFLAFYKKAKEESSFGYQVMVSISEFFEVIAFGIYVAAFYWFSGLYEGHSAFWFQSSYACMWFTAHFAFPFFQSFITISLLLAIAVAADRVFALGKPFVYRNINHRRHQVIACILCVIIGASSSFYDSFTFGVGVGEGGLYTVVVDDAFVSSTMGIALSQLRNFIRVAGTLVLVLSNIVMVALYRRYTGTVGHMTSTSTTNDARNKRRREQEKVLMLLALFESIFIFCTMFAVTFYHVGLFLIPNFFDCYDHFFGCLVDALIEIFDICDFYVVFAVSKPFREIVFGSIPCLKRFVTKNGNITNVPPNVMSQQRSVNA